MVSHIYGAVQMGYKTIIIINNLHIIQKCYQIGWATNEHGKTYSIYWLLSASNFAFVDMCNLLFYLLKELPNMKIGYV